MAKSKQDSLNDVKELYTSYGSTPVIGHTSHSLIVGRKYFQVNISKEQLRRFGRFRSHQSVYYLHERDAKLESWAREHAWKVSARINGVGPEKLLQVARLTGYTEGLAELGLDQEAGPQ